MTFTATYEGREGCPTCHHHFTSVSACNRHETPHGCADPGTLRTKNGDPVFQLVDRYGGNAWALAGTYTGPETT